jgi:DNA-binding MarR family transcriptional regulator
VRGWGLGADRARSIAEYLLREREKHAAVLVYLLRAGQALEVELRRAMTGGRYLADARTASKVIRELAAMNLVEQSSVGARYRLYKLTELGRAVAEEISQRLETPQQPQRRPEALAPAARSAEVQPVETAPLAQPEAAARELLQAPAAPAGAAEALRWAGRLLALSDDVMAVAAAHGVDAQPLVRGLLMEAAALLRRGGLDEEAARLEEVAKQLREPGAGEAAAVEEVLARVRAMLAWSRRSPGLGEALEVVKLFKNHSANAR